MNKIKKGDEVIVITGAHKGKRGAVLSFDDERIVVDGVTCKKHKKANPNAGDKGGIVDIPMPIHRSNVMLYDPTAKKHSRVGIRTLKDGQRARYFKGSDQLVEVKG